MKIIDIFSLHFLCIFCLKIFLFFILIWGHFFSIAFREEREKRGERNTIARSSNWLPLSGNHRLGIIGTRIKERTHKLGMCPNLTRESNLQCFGYKTTLQPTEPHQPGLKLFLFLPHKDFSFLFSRCNTSLFQYLIINTSLLIVVFVFEVSWSIENISRKYFGIYVLGKYSEKIMLHLCYDPILHHKYTQWTG